MHVPTNTLVKFNPEWEGPLLGDKSWTAIFDNSKVKAVAGDFTCAENLSEILAEPIHHLKQRLANKRPPKGDLDQLIDRICKAQSALG